MLLSRAAAFEILECLLLHTESRPQLTNSVILSPAILSGTPFPGAGRLEIVAITQEGKLVQGGLGGHLAAAVKNAGYDHVVVTGEADRPVYLYINDNCVDIRNAAAFSGMGVQEMLISLKSCLDDDDFSCAGIGKAGERRVTTATIQDGITFSSAPAGTGAVFGAMNLKAVVCIGNEGIVPEEPARLYKACSAVNSQIRQRSKAAENTASAYGFLHGNNKRLDAFNYRYRAAGVACHGCSLTCHGNYHVVPAGRGVMSGELLRELFQQCGGVSGDDCFQYALHCQQLGIDSIGFLVLLKRLRLLKNDKEGTELYPPEENDWQIFLRGAGELLEKTAAREDVGAVLAQGQEGIDGLLAGGGVLEEYNFAASGYVEQRELSSDGDSDLLSAEAYGLCKHVSSLQGSLAGYYAEAVSGMLGRTVRVEQFTALYQEVLEAEKRCAVKLARDVESSTIATDGGEA